MYEQVVPGEHLIGDWRIGLTTIYDPLVLIRQYCGLNYSDREREMAPETWAFSYFDEVAFPDGDLARPIDVLASSTLSASARFEHLEFFVDHGFDLLRRWLQEVPTGIALDEASEEVLAKVGTLNQLTSEVPLSLLSKVAFRLRPSLIPIYEASTASLYRKRTDGRGEASWPALVREIAKDTSDEVNPNIGHVQVQITSDLAENWRRRTVDEPVSRPTDEPDLMPPPPSKLRLFDIAVFMAGQFGFHEPERMTRMSDHREHRWRLHDERLRDRQARASAVSNRNPWDDVVFD